MRHRVVHSPSSTFSPANSSSSSTSPASPPPPASRAFSFSSSTASSSSPSVRRSLLQDLDKEGQRAGLPRIQDHNNNNEEEESPLAVIQQQLLLLPRPSPSWWRPLFGSSSTRIASSENNSNNNMPTNKNGSSSLNNDNNGSSSSSSSIPKFAYRELTLGRVIGQGGFSMVHEVTSMDLDDVFDTSEQETALRKEFARHVNSSNSQNNSNSNSNGSKGRYVLKTLRTDLPEDEHAKGVLDLAIEANFLSVPRLQQHPNFIRMVAMANSDPHASRFFVVLERLDVTLEKKFNAWRKVVTDNAGYYIPCLGYCCAKAPILHALWKERFQVSLDIASAMLYLHKEGIVYRDLKPDNIGFAGNVVKLFDFGLAKRLKDVEPNENDEINLNDDSGSGNTCPTYHLTGNTGSLRYMAPEVARDECYGLSVDVYSFGIIFWQICSLQTPYAKYSAKMHAERVVRQGQRPKPDLSWPRRWVLLQQSCWSSDYTMRPSFDAIVPELTDILQEMQDDDGVIPTRATEMIRAKKKKKPIAEHNLDVDTRISSSSAAAVAPGGDAGGGGANGTTNKRFDNDIV